MGDDFRAGLPGPRRENGASALKRALAGEAAANLCRLGRAVERALTRLREASNPALAPLKVLVGTWNTVGAHPLVPGKTFHGQTSFAWIEGGAFLIMR
jgi:hypothetical protein